MEQNRKELEKIAVQRTPDREFYYTGFLTDLKDGWVQIDTERGEILKFKKEQILSRKVIGQKNGKDKQDIQI